MTETHDSHAKPYLNGCKHDQEFNSTFEWFTCWFNHGRFTLIMASEQVISQTESKSTKACSMCLWKTRVPQESPVTAQPQHSCSSTFTAFNAVTEGCSHMFNLWNYILLCHQYTPFQTNTHSHPRAGLIVPQGPPLSLNLPVTPSPSFILPSMTQHLLLDVKRLCCRWTWSAFVKKSLQLPFQPHWTL